VLECRDLAEQAGLTRADAAAVADTTVALFGARAASVWRGADGPAADGRLIRGVGLPLVVVRFCVDEEWATTLDDLIERRLMLSFHERLSREAIAEVAAALADAGALATDRVAAAVDGCVARLEERYGRRVPPTSKGPGRDGATMHKGE
jgi:glycerol-3-phosphate dehydrogenase